MTQQGTPSSTSTTMHTREQLLRMLKRDPTSVSRAEIKAAFQDGRLGDEDLDIPTLAGMKRISFNRNACRSSNAVRKCP